MLYLSSFLSVWEADDPPSGGSRNAPSQLREHEMLYLSSFLSVWEADDPPSGGSRNAPSQLRGMLPEASRARLKYIKYLST